MAGKTVTSRERSPKGRGRKSQSYHHGDLRQALIDATRELVIQRGAENFSLADACRLAGVTTAAPYKHFRDKDEILGEVIAQGFDMMEARQLRVAADYDKGSLERIVAIGQDYVAFAVDEPALFRLMFGQNPRISANEDVAGEGKKCFAFVIDEVVAHVARHARPIDPMMTAVQLWTLVHGAACLRIEGNYEKVAPGIDVDAMIAFAGRRILAADDST